MNLKDMRIGTYGLSKEMIGTLKSLFGSVELIVVPAKREFDIYFFDVTYASRRVREYIKSISPCPMILMGRDEKSIKQLNLFSDTFYLHLDYCEQCSEELLGKLVRPYVEEYEEKKYAYIGMKALFEGLEESFGGLADIIEEPQKETAEKKAPVSFNAPPVLAEPELNPKEQKILLWKKWREGGYQS